MGKRIFVSGAAGFLGSNLVKRLVSEGEEVNAFIYCKAEHPFLRDLPIKRFDGDILDLGSLKRAMEGCIEVYHTAGIVSYLKRDYRKMMRVHVDGTRNVLDAARDVGVERVVHTSSCSAIGLPESADEAYDEGVDWNERNNWIGYMASKRLAEREAYSACSKGLDVVIVNPTSFFGQGDINMNEGELFRNIKRGKIRFAPLGGNSVVSIDDVVEGHLLAMKNGRAGERYILSNEFLRFEELFNTIADELGVERVRGVLPKSSFYLLYPASFLTEWLGMSLTPQVVNFSFKFRYYDSSKAKRELGWEPRVSFREAVRRGIEFYEGMGLI